jgi:hypothetical protein
MFWHLRLPITIGRVNITALVRNARTSLADGTGNFRHCRAATAKISPCGKFVPREEGERGHSHKFDARLVHQPVRLNVKAALKTLPPREQLGFTRLKGIVGATDGDLGAHIATLAQSGYLEIEKDFVGKKTAQTRAPHQDGLPSLRWVYRLFARHSWTGMGEDRIWTFLTSLHSASFKPTHAPSAQLLFPDIAFGSDPGASY